MSQQELSRLEVIQRICRKTLTQRRAADLLSLSVRQVKRLCRAYRREGAAALVSQRRGRPSNNRLRPELVSAARALLRERYHDFGPTFAREKLCEVHGLRLAAVLGDEEAHCGEVEELPGVGGDYFCLIERRPTAGAGFGGVCDEAVGMRHLLEGRTAVAGLTTGLTA